MLAFEIHGAWFVRKQCSSYQIQDGKISCTWSPLDGITVETELMPTEWLSWKSPDSNRPFLQYLSLWFFLSCHCRSGASGRPRPITSER